jgi:Rrf2 family protein
MKFSTKTTYGIRALAFLASRTREGSIPLSAIAKKESISPKYLERIFNQLKKSGIVVSEKGVGGGYKLAQKPSQINFLKVVEALEGDIAPFYCLQDSANRKCAKKIKCPAQKAMLEVKKAMQKTLKNIKLKDVI